MNFLQIYQIVYQTEIAMKKRFKRLVKLQTES